MLTSSDERQYKSPGHWNSNFSFKLALNTKREKSEDKTNDSIKITIAGPVNE